VEIVKRVETVKGGNGKGGNSEKVEIVRGP
jgi:hypothetical protein